MVSRRPEHFAARYPISEAVSSRKGYRPAPTAKADRENPVKKRVYGLVYPLAPPRTGSYDSADGLTPG
jgi:hypothetical protein